METLKNFQDIFVHPEVPPQTQKSVGQDMSVLPEVGEKSRVLMGNIPKQKKVMHAKNAHRENIAWSIKTMGLEL